MLLPLLLIVFATGAATIVAYGTHPDLANLSHGLSIIMLSRRLEWPLVTFSLLLCIALLALVIAGKQRAWWLIGLAPVLALFVHSFNPLEKNRPMVLDEPAWVVPDQGNSLHDDWWVVGIVFNDQAYALPYHYLYTTPVVFITDYDKRFVVMWSAFANRAVACTVTREFKPRDLEIVSTPLNTLLLYDRRLGQFIVALTGQTVAGNKPVGFSLPVQTHKTTWSIWLKQHPGTKLLQGYPNPLAQPVPILPRNPDVSIEGLPARTMIDIAHTNPPAAMPAASSRKLLDNRVLGQTRVLVITNPATHEVELYDRNAKEDLFLTFQPRTIKKHPDAVMNDRDTNSWWTIDGKCIDGQLKGTQLKLIPVEKDLYWGPMKRWYPELAVQK